MKTLLVMALTLMGQSLSTQANPVQSDPRAQFLIEQRCPDCHTVVALKIRSTADVGPDLSAAYADVPFRYGMTLERFFAQPAGIMRMVLGGRPTLERAERDSLVTLFRQLYIEQLAKLDSAQRRLRPVEAKRQSREAL